MDGRSFWIGGVVVPFLVACSPSEAAISRALEQTREVEIATFTSVALTEAAKPTNTPTATSTPKPTSTSTPIPLQELLTIALDESDLPANFFEIDPLEMDIDEDDLRAIYLETDTSIGPFFSFFNEDDFQIVMGWTVLIENRLERVTYDIFIENYGQEIMEAFSSELGTQLVSQRVVQNLEGIGESALGFQVIGEVEDTPFNLVVDSIFFRRDLVAPNIFNIYIEGSSPQVSIEELATILDNKIVEVIESNY